MLELWRNAANLSCQRNMVPLGKAKLPTRPACGGQRCRHVSVIVGAASGVRRHAVVVGAASMCSTSIPSVFGSQDLGAVKSE